jgi:hemerythrin-like metal-binding protein
MCQSLYIVWNESYNLGIPILDEQHRSIVSTINTLHHFIQNGKSESIISAILNNLEQYTSIHFTTEEQLMLKFGFPDLNKHISHHRHLASRTAEMLDSSEGVGNHGQATLQFLKEWWLDHISLEDPKFVPYLMRLTA